KGLPKDVTHLEGRRLALLFMVGEQRRDIIPKSLSAETLEPSERTQVIELIVYETGEMATFEESFSMLLQQAAKQTIKEQWVVVFSPQGCEAMLTSLRWLDESTGRFSQARREATRSKGWIGVATIGPTTRDYLKEAFAFNADVCAETPTPEGVSEGIQAFRNQIP
ncbi:uroporphyrinogen-III synthase, partial [Oleoguttula sp. CCFEE 5521]